MRIALNALKRVQQISRCSDLRHELAYASFLDPADLSRFCALNVVADLSLYIWYPSPMNDSMVSAVGERGTRYWPIRDLLEEGAPLPQVSLSPLVMRLRTAVPQ